MKKMLTALALCLALGGCGSNIRNTATYTTEISFMGSVVNQEESTDLALLNSSVCSCANNTWAPAVCATAADNLVTLHARWSWHQAMMLYNGGITSTDPGSAPSIPATTCTLPTLGGN